MQGSLSLPLHCCSHFPLLSSGFLLAVFPVVLESNKECLEKPIKPSSPIQFGGWIKTSQVESGPASRADGQAQGKDVFALINQKKKKIYSVAFHFQAAPTDVSTNLEWLQGLHNWSKVTSNRQTFCAICQTDWTGWTRSRVVHDIRLGRF